MILLTVVAVGLLSLSATSLRSSGQGAALATARANARLALCLAIGELQKQAGPDQRVSAAASLAGSLDNPSWTGVWRSDQADSVPTWLVSGANPDPAAALPAASSALFLGASSEDPASREIRAPLVKIEKPRAPGRLAWWVGDEGVKARVDLAKPEQAAGSAVARLGQSQSPLEPDLRRLGEQFKDLGPDSVVSKTALITMATVSLAAAAPDLPRSYFDDLTSGGFGLPVNVAKGRLKTDLSLLFDRSQAGKSHVREYLGATGNNALPTQGFSISSPEKFYLSDSRSASA